MYGASLIKNLFLVKIANIITLFIYDVTGSGKKFVNSDKTITFFVAFRSVQYQLSSTWNSIYKCNLCKKLRH